MHGSQKTIERDNFGITVQLNVVHNFELEKDILGFGDGVRVLEPKRLRKSITSRIENAKENYDTELSDKGLLKTKNLLDHRGSAILNRVYPIRAIKKLDYWVRKYRKEKDEKLHLINEITTVIPQTKEWLFTQNLDQIINAILPESDFVRADLHLGYSNHWSQNEWYQYRDLTDKHRIIRFYFHEMSSHHGAAMVYTGSHKAIHDHKTIEIITNNTEPAIAEVGLGGLHIFHPWLLQRYPVEQVRKGRRMMEMLFVMKTELG